MTARWNGEKLPPQDGRSVLVTGANAGLGLVVARRLASAGARVRLGCRSPSKGQEAIAAIRASVPKADVGVEIMDLASFASVRSAAARWISSGEPLDLLINNAGVMTPPAGKTADGLELQIGTNHFGHYLLTGLLMPLLERSAAEGRDARVVSVSSIAAVGGAIDFDNLRLEKPYSAYREYQQSKIANLIFALELDRRLRARGSAIRSVAAHPGVSATELQRHFSAPVAAIVRFVSMSAERGALPTLYASVEDVAGGSYIGPDGFREIRGWPAPARIDPAAQVRATATRLFEVSAEITGVSILEP